MQPDQWQIAKDLFRLALDEPSADREAYVARRCDEPAIRAEVLRLLRLHGDTSDFLVSPLEPDQYRGAAAPIPTSVEILAAVVNAVSYGRAANGPKFQP